MKPLSSAQICRALRLPGIWILVLGLFVFYSHSLADGSPEETFTRGNTSFVSGNYADSIREYESLLQQNCYSAALFFNLGNAYSCNGNIGLAILNYERALWLDPGNADFKANLELTRQKAGLFEESPALWQVLPKMLSLKVWLWLAVFSFILFSMGCSVLLLKIPIRWSLRPLTLIFLMTCVIFSASASVWTMDLNRAVIITPEAALQIAPLDNSPSIFNLAAGSTVRIQKQRGNFYYVRARDGKLGWVSDKHAQRIVNAS